MNNNLLRTIQTIVDKVLSTKTFTDINLGTVSSINPLKIIIMDSMLELNETNLILTESVIRKEISIKTHKHFFEADYFKHNHGSPILGGNGLNVVVSGQAAFVPAGSQVQLKEGQKSFDLSDPQGEFESLYLPEPTKEYLKVVVNGKEIPLSKDPEGDKEQDKDNSEVYWGVLNHGLYPEDKVLLLQCRQGSKWVVLSKVYESYYYREDEE